MKLLLAADKRGALFSYGPLLDVNLILKCSFRCLNGCLIPIIMPAFKVLVRKIRGAELQHTWQLLMGRYIVGISCQWQCFSQHYAGERIGCLVGGVE